MSSTAFSEYTNRNEVTTVPSVLDHSKFKKNLWALLQGRQPKWFFLILAIFHNHFEFVPISRERVVPTERQVRTVLVDCMSKAKVISIQTPRYRQFALISDFLDLAHLSTREEQNHPRIGSKTDPKGWNFRILCCPLLQAQQYAVIRRMWRQMFGTLLNNASHRAQGNNGSFTGIHQQLQGIFSPNMSVLRRHFPNLQFECCMILQGTLGGNFDIFAASGESTAWVLFWKICLRPIGVCPVAQFIFFSTAFDPRVWTTDCFLERKLGMSAPADYTRERRRK